MDFRDCLKFATESGFYYHTATAKSDMREAEIPIIKFRGGTITIYALTTL